MNKKGKQLSKEGKTSEQVSGSVSPLEETDGNIELSQTQSLSQIESLYPCCRKLPMWMFEEYVIAQDLAGMSEEHWDRLYSEYTELTADTSTKGTISSLGRMNYLALRLARVETLLNAIQLFYDEQLEGLIDISPIIKSAKAEFKQIPVKFTSETYQKDIEICTNLMKAHVQDYTILAKQLQNKSQVDGSKNTFFDDVLMGYSAYRQVPLPDRNTISTQTFALIVKDLNNASRPN